MPANPDKVIRDAVIEIVRKQVEVGVDIVSDGEMGKISYATYIKDRLSGFDGDTPREPGQDLVEHPRLLEKLAKLGSTAKYRRPRCVAEIKVKDLGPMHEDIANLQAAIAAGKPTEALHQHRLPRHHRAVPAQRLLQDAGCLPRGRGRRHARRVRGPDAGGAADPDRRARHGHGPAHHVPRPHRERFRRPCRAARRGAEPCAAQRARGPHPHARVLGQLRRPAHARRADGKAAAGGDEGQAAGHPVRGRQSAPRARVEGVPRSQIAGARRQDPGARRAQHHHQLRRAPRAGRRAAGELRQRRRPRARHRRHRLRLRHLCRIRPGGPGHRVAEAQVPGGWRGHRVEAALGR